MNFIDKLKQAADNLVTLNITTAVGDVEMDAQSGKYKPAANAQIMHTSIDLLQGDITTIIPESFTQPPFSVLRQFHQTREESAQQIIKNNIACLRELAKLIEGLDDKEANE